MSLCLVRPCLFVQSQSPCIMDLRVRLLTVKKHGSVIFRQEARWYDYWTNEKYKGGQYVTVEAPIDRIPVFVKAGAVIPVADGLVYAQQEPKKPIQLMVYPGADGEFVLYEDEGNNYNFENGAYAITKLVWDESAGRLNIGEREGSFPGMREAVYQTVIEK